MSGQQQGAPEGSAVVYQLPMLLDSVAGSILVVGYGSPMKRAVGAVAKIGCEDLWVTGTDDKARAFSCSGAAKVASLGPRFDARLFTNEYAILTAAAACNAGALLMVDVDAAASNLLRCVAAAEGRHVLVPLPKDRSYTLWVEYPPDSPASNNSTVTASKGASAVEGAEAWPAPAAGTEPVDVDWARCPKCKLFHDKKVVLADGGVCPTCHELYRLNSDERLAATFDVNSFEEWDRVLPEPDPLGFPGYEELLAKQRSRSGLEEAVRCGVAALKGRRVAVCIMESTFMMGSMGEVVGEKITRVVERATNEGLPLIIFTASGGARMQEGLVSLMQMAKISSAIEQHGRAGLLYVSVITDPTTGGVTASFAMQGDIIVSEPHALIGFAGRRVIQDTIKQTLPDEFQTAEFALAHGLIDAIVERADLPSFLSNVLALHEGDVSATSKEGALSTEEPSASSARQVAARIKGAASRSTAADGGLFGGVRRLFTRPSVEGGIQASSLKRALKKRGVADTPAVRPIVEDSKSADNPAWESVLLARNVHRPTAQYYINRIFDDFIELHGDRMFADDGAILGGIGWFDGHPVTVVAEEKGADLTQRIARNFGCPQPEGYRKSLRLMRQAEKFGRPIVCLVDTQGAYCGAESEERGQGNAIADNLVVMAGLTVPVVCIVLGEGGSGGALALAMGNRVAMQEHAVYSVLSPEGFASILWKDRTRAAEAAAVMKMSAAEACEMGLVEEVLPEGAHPAHENPDEAVMYVRDFVERSFEELSELSPEELRQQRYNRFRVM